MPFKKHISNFISGFGDMFHSRSELEKQRQQIEEAQFIIKILEFEVDTLTNVIETLEDLKSDKTLRWTNSGTSPSFMCDLCGNSGYFETTGYDMENLLKKNFCVCPTGQNLKMINSEKK